MVFGKPPVFRGVEVLGGEGGVAKRNSMKVYESFFANSFGVG